MKTEHIKIDTSYRTWSSRDWSDCSVLGDLIIRHIPFAKDYVGNLFWFDGGVYKPGGEEVIAEMYYRALDVMVEKNNWKPRRAKEITEYIAVQANTLWSKPPLDLINFKNGLYDWEAKELLPHRPDYLSTIQIPISYDPTASCPNWDRFLNEILPGGEQLLIEIIGLCMIPLTSLQKCVVLVGSGSNGKSTYLNALQEAIGHDNICNIPLHVLTNPQERFARSGIVGKLVNIFGDLSAKKVEEAANFKPLVGQDRLTIEYKHKDSFSYTPFCRLIFSTNHPVLSDDDSEGYKRRFLNIPFNQRFQVDPRKGEELAETLKQPKELSGLLNRILPRIPFIVEDGFTITDEIAAMVEDWCVMPDTTKHWLEANLVPDLDGFVPAQAFYNFYCGNCPNSEPFERRKLITYIKNLFPTVIANYVSRVEGKNVRGYKGVKLATSDGAFQVARFTVFEKEVSIQ